MASAAGGTAAAAPCGDFTGFRVFAIDAHRKDGVHLLHDLVHFLLGDIVLHHVLVAHDFSVNVLQLLVEDFELFVVPLGFLHLVIHVQSFQVKLADTVLQCGIIIAGSLCFPQSFVFGACLNLFAHVSCHFDQFHVFFSSLSILKRIAF